MTDKISTDEMLKNHQKTRLLFIFPINLVAFRNSIRTFPKWA